ncbi:PKD domain-containing protein [Polaribacter batillariae]|uniref:PKD domain-containing protein n=1 Tax=Polaribacter batillariae TaxID=2808900 RepID=A0ABX7SSY2_9FLAO|nr:LamG-like jellyroll fold domain-containing protein [Polaribacter batillariae]QTD37355.1 PKD domain-containing protein [Polaribacter batillariae]
MKKIYLKLTASIIFFLMPLVLNAQDYKEMMEDTKYNVYDVIKAGNQYFKNKDKGKGSGYKQFQRWIIQNEDLFYPSGDRTNFRPELPYLIANSKKQKSNLIKNAQSKATSNSWTEVGPFVELKRFYDNVRNGNGRVDAIWVDPSNANRIYIGCRGGGMWKTIDGGTNWTVKTDNLGITGVNSIAVNTSNVNEIYIATALAGRRSLGIFKSTDGGNNWNPTSVSYQLTANTIIFKVLMSPTNSSVLFAATSAGLLKSTDGFQTHTTVLSGNIIDVEFKPGDTSIMYASNDANNTIYRSTNSGSSFSSTGVVGTARPQIGVSANQPSYVYIADKGVSYRSTNSGVSFTSRGNPDGGKGQYGGFAVSDTNANLLINGSLDTYRSTNGGSSFSKVTDWRYSQSTGVGGNFVHADVREVEIVNGAIYLGTDGWLCKSTDGGLNYEILTYNLGNQEIYEKGLGVAQTNANTLIIGTQDNGTNILRNGAWHHWKGGDGGTSMIDAGNANIMYGSLYNGNFKRTDNAGTTSTSTDLGDTNTTGRSLPPLRQDPVNPAIIYMGGEKDGKIRKSTNRGNSFTNLTGVGVNDFIDEMAIAPSNGNYIFTSIKNRIWKSTNGGSSWSEITGNLPNLVIKGIAVDYNNPNKIVVCYTGYASGTKVYRSTNGGSSWSNISGNLPNVPTTDVVYDDDNKNTMYLSTETGVYYRDDNDSDWTKYGIGLPNVRANDLEIQHNSSTLFVGTWGRGVWRIPLKGISGTGDLQLHHKYNNSLTDESSYERDGSTTGSETYITGYDGNAYSVTSNNTISINGYKGISGNSARTVSAWIKTTNVGLRKTIASWGTNSPGQMFNVMVSNGNIRVEGGSSNVQNDDSTVALLNNNTWRHVAVTYDPSDGSKLKDIKIYIDGIYYANQPDSGDSYNSQNTTINTNTTTNNVLIGAASYNSSYYWQGGLDDVRIYSKALTASEIAALASSSVVPTANFTSNVTTITAGNTINFTDTSSDTPTSWLWSFSGGNPATSTVQNPSITYATAGTYNVTLTATNSAGSDVETKLGYITINASGTADLQLHHKYNSSLTDESSYGRNGSTTGSETYITGYDGNAYSVTSNNTISINGYKGISGNSARTVSAWIKTTNVGLRKTIASWGTNSPGQMFNVMVSNGNIRVEGGSSNVQNDDSTVALLNNNTWRHVAVTYDPSDGSKLKDIKIYIDGIYYANQPDSGDSYNSQNTTINTNTTTNNVLIGAASYNSSYYWQGGLDDVRIYSKALTASEIAALASSSVASTVNATNAKVLHAEKIIEDIQFRFLPNPVKDILKIKIDSDNLQVDTLEATIYTLNGKEVLIKKIKKDSYDSFELNTATLSKGVYFIKLNTKKQSLIKKFIKN